MPLKAILKCLILRIIGNPVWVRRLQAPVIFKMLELTRGDTVLDAGCGRGYFLGEIAKKSKTTFGVDLNLKSNSPVVCQQHERVIFVKCDVQKLPFVAEKFDKILLSSVLQMVEDDKMLLDECHRVLKDTGLLVLSVTVGYYYVRKLNDLKSELKNRFGALGKGYYSFNEVVSILKDEQFQILEMQFSPKKLGSLLYELELYLWFRFNTSFFSSVLFPFFWVLSYFDNFDRAQIGNELIIKARKFSC